MRFDVLGAWRYQVGIAAEAIIEPDGTERKGKVFEADRLVQISPNLPRKNRLEVALHELGHAWLMRLGGLPTCEEVLCDFVAAFTVSSIRFLTASGGETALMRLNPGEKLQPYTARIKLTLNRYCGICSTTVAAGSVECVPDPTVIGQMKLSLYCPHCNHVQSWNETAGPTGLPTAEQVTDNTYQRGRAVADFLRRHPECSVEFQG